MASAIIWTVPDNVDHRANDDERLAERRAAGSEEEGTLRLPKSLLS